jgi:ketosteroid isomerase-like protein
MSDDLEHFRATYRRHYNAGDAVGVSGLYDPDALWLAAAGAALRGSATIGMALRFFMDQVPPRLSLEERARRVGPELAATFGVYRLDGETGDDRSIGGSYADVLRCRGGTWRIVAQQMNYDITMSPEMWVGSRSVVTSLAERGWVGAMLGAGLREGGTALRPLLADDAWIALGGRPAGRGSAEIELLVDQIIRIEVHDLDTAEIDDASVADHGWFDLELHDGRSGWGTYSMLAGRGADGWQIEWLVATWSPLQGC